MKKVLIRVILLALIAVGVDVCAQPDPCGVPVAVTPSAPFFEDFEGGAMPSCWTQSGILTWSVVQDNASSSGWS